jgi:hypothetical protein
MAKQVTVVPVHGRTAIAVDGRVIPGMSYTSYVYAGGGSNESAYREVVEAGIGIYLCPWSFHTSASGAPAWPAPGVLDLTLLERQMALVAGLSESTWLIPRLYLDTPHWWAEAYPEELVRYADSDGEPPRPDGTHGNLAQASWASPRWREDIAELLRELVARVEGGPYAERVLGYMINSGGTEEWVAWGAQQGKVGDYSAPARRAFQAWLQGRYGKEEALAAAWRQPGLKWDGVQVPSEAARRRGSPGLLRDPQQDQASIDYDLFYSELGVETLLGFCRVVKQAAARQVLTGASTATCCGRRD